MTKDEIQSKKTEINRQIDDLDAKRFSLLTQMEELDSLVATNNPYPDKLAPEIELADIGKFNWFNAYSEWGKSEQWLSFRDAQLKEHKKCYYCGKPAETFHHIKYAMTLSAEYTINDWLNPYFGVCVCNNCHDKITKALSDRKQELKAYLQDNNTSDILTDLESFCDD